MPQYVYKDHFIYGGMRCINIITVGGNCGKSMIIKKEYIEDELYKEFLFDHESELNYSNVKSGNLELFLVKYDNIRAHMVMHVIDLEQAINDLYMSTTWQEELENK